MSIRNIISHASNPFQVTQEFKDDPKGTAHDIGESFGKLVTNPTGSLAGKLGHLGGWRSKEDRQAKAAAENAVTQAAAATKQQEDALMAQYNNPLDTGNQARVDTYRQQQQLALRRALGTAGGANSSGMIAGENAISQGATDLESGIRATWWTEAMKLHGMSENSIAYLDKMNEIERANKIADFSALMQSVGAVSIYSMQLNNKPKA